MQLTITSENPTFTLINMRIERITFTRKDAGPRVKLFTNGLLIMELTASLDLPCDRPGRHEDLLPLWSGIYTVEGLLPSDSFVIQYRPATAKPEPPILSEYDIERGREEYCKEQRRRIAHQPRNAFGQVLDNRDN